MPLVTYGAYFLTNLDSNRDILKLLMVTSWSTSGNVQKQPLEVFYNKNCFQKFRNIYRKTLVLGSPFSKVAGLKTCDFIKKRLQNRMFSGEYCEIFKNTYFKEHLWMATSESRCAFTSKFCMTVTKLELILKVYLFSQVLNCYV